MMPNSELKLYGPLANLIGVWEGMKGSDVAPGDDRGTENNQYKEKMEFEPIGLVQNHEQHLYGLRYKTTAWRLGEEASFHEEVGYYLWDAEALQMMRCFIVPRGVSVLAGGTVRPDGNEFQLEANVGSSVFGICSNPFLDREFKTVKFEMKIAVTTESLTYTEDTQLRMKGREDIFHHTDGNTLKRVSK